MFSDEAMTDETYLNPSDRIAHTLERVKSKLDGLVEGGRNKMQSSGVWGILTNKLANTPTGFRYDDPRADVIDHAWVRYNRPSMLQHIEAGRRTEIGTLNAGTRRNEGFERARRADLAAAQGPGA